MEWEAEVNHAAGKAPKRTNALRTSLILRYVMEAIVFGFLAGAIGYGIQTATGWDAVLSYIIGVVLVAGFY